MKTEHTPGPWAWQLFGDTYSLTAQHGRREQIISAIPHGQMKYPVVAMASDGRLQDVDPKHPNARLIASAPDLLDRMEIVQGVLKALHKEESDKASPDQNRLRAFVDTMKANSEAIRKAKGE